MSVRALAQPQERMASFKTAIIAKPAAPSAPQTFRVRRAARAYRSISGRCRQGFRNSVTVWPCLQLCASQRQLSIAASPNGTARLSEDPAGDEGKPVYRAGHWCSLPKRKEKATVATDAEHAKKKSKAAQTGEDVPFSIYSVFDDDELPDVRSTPSSNVGVIPEDKLSDGTRQNPHDADGDLKGVAAIERGEMREPMMSDARRVRSLTRRSKRLADALLATLVD